VRAAAAVKDGIYGIRFLQVEDYRVTVGGAGFQTQELPKFELEQDMTAKFRLIARCTRVAVARSSRYGIFS